MAIPLESVATVFDHSGGPARVRGELARRCSFAVSAAVAMVAGSCHSSSARPVCGGGEAGSAADAVADGSTAPAPFTITALDRVGIGSDGSTGWAFIGTAVADIDWSRGPFSSVSLVIDLESACYPFEKWSTDRPPPGQNWPADCDAFDRNFNFFIDDAGADAGAGAIPYEIVHAVTPFGGPEHLEVELGDLANALPGSHRLRVDLGSYPDATGTITGSNAGWTVSAHLDVTPGPASHHVIAAVPLFQTSLSATDIAPVASFTVPVGATGGRIEYRTSGHGQGPVAFGCTGPAEEFCPRRHSIFVDGARIDDVEAYRRDCGTFCTVVHQGPPDAGFDYCQENPCGAIASVRAARANWCPGSLTAPFAWENLAAFTVPGPHTFSSQISAIVSGGTWLVSAIYYAYAD